jgi:hypothetical protein
MKVLLCILPVYTLTLISCASYQTINSLSPEKVQNSEKKAVGLVHSMYLIGDAGGSQPGIIAPALKALQFHAKGAGKHSSLLFLGDNIYPNGMVKKNDPTRDACEHALKVQLDVIKTFPGKSFIIPGNHDWRNNLEGVKRQENFVKDYLDDKRVFLPRDGCAGPEVIELTENLILVIIDSEWWLRDWDLDPKVNRDCEIKTRSELILALTDLLKKNRNRDIVLAFHHPLYTYGVHGGYYTFKDHLFPFTALEKDLWIPLPVIGSLYPLLRGNAGIKQDHNYPPFVEFKNEILAATREFENVIFVAGHEHNLQYIIEDRHPFIVSGSGSKSSPLHRGKALEFGSSDQGFAVLNFYSDGSVQLRFFKAGEDGSAGLLYETWVQGPDKPEPDVVMDDLVKEDSATLSIYSDEETRRSKLYQWFWGRWYRDLYGTAIRVPTLNLETSYGGLTPARRGGGMQTLSLRLKDSQDREYVVRGLQKNATSLLPQVFQNTFVADLMRDFFTTAHPYAALTIPPMADAISVYHANPRLYYLPKQPALGRFNPLFGSALHLFEEHASGDWSHLASFGNSKDIISTADLLHKLQQNDHHRLDRPYIIRSRLFDLVLKDWDRHQDQWRWAEIPDKKEKVKYYRPIPRDRDQAFAHFDGFFTRLATRSVINLRPMQPFVPITKKVHWLTWGTRYFDRRFLNEASWPEWEKEIGHIQSNLTDEVIDSALHTLPDEIYRQGGSHIADVLKARRDHLPVMAQKLYRFLARSVDVVGTNDEDFFLVERLDREKVRVTVYYNDDRKKKNPIYQRTFSAAETREIHLYGLEDDDYFEVSGDPANNIKIRLIGGKGKDHFRETSTGNPDGKQILIYDDLGENTLEKGADTRDKRSIRRFQNEYRFTDFQYNYSLAVPYAAFLSDDGAFIGGFITHQVSGFKKQPYSQSHTFNLNYAFATNGYQVSWKGRFVEAFGRWDYQPSILYQTPRYTSNFYGLGNDTESIFDKDFYRVRTKIFRMTSGIRRQYKSGVSLGVIPQFEQVKVENTVDRFISSISSTLRPGVFENQSYAGIDLVFAHEQKQTAAYPVKGMQFNGSIGWKQNLNERNRSFVRLSQALIFYLPVNRRETVVLATRFSANQIFGKFDFYHGVSEGGFTSLRGLRPERLNGRASVTHSNDLRIPILRVKNNIIPFVVGITGSLDHGRVFIETRENSDWHISYGGSLWLNFVNAAVIRTGWHHSIDGSRVIVALGYAF